MHKKTAKNCGFQLKSYNQKNDKKPKNARLEALSGPVFAVSTAEDRFAGMDALSAKGQNAPSAALDRIGDPFTPPEHKDEQNWRLAKASRRSLFQNGVHRSVGACGMPGKDTANVSFRKMKAHDGSSRISTDGVSHCGSARCPRCAPLRASDVSGRVGAVLKAMNDCGFGGAFATWTMRHDRNTILSDMRKAQSAAISALQRGGLWNRLRRDGLVGFIRVFEVTWGVRTGWHLHVHAILIHEAGSEAAVQAGQALTGRWIDLLAKAGHVAVGSGQKVKPISQDQGLSDYGVSDLRGWGVAAEMAAGWIKTGKRPDRFNVPELLAFAAEGDTLAGQKYAEAVEALSGQRLLVVGPRLKAALDLDFEAIADEEPPELEAQEEGTIGLLSSSVWKRAANHPRFDHAWIICTVRKLSLVESIEWCDVSLLIWQRVMGDDPPD